MTWRREFDVSDPHATALELLAAAAPVDYWRNPASRVIWRQLLPHVLAAN